MLQDSWVDAIFARLAVRYGAAWLRMWEGIDIGAVKADWARELAGFNGEALKHALDNLPPERPPTVGQFKSLCINRPIPAEKQLPRPPAKEEAVALARNYQIKVGGSAGKEWAHNLRRRELACERLTSAQRAMWRAALAEAAVPQGPTTDEQRALDDKREQQAKRVAEYAAANGIQGVAA